MPLDRRAQPYRIANEQTIDGYAKRIYLFLFNGRSSVVSFRERTNVLAVARDVVVIFVSCFLFIYWTIPAGDIYKFIWTWIICMNERRNEEILADLLRIWCFIVRQFLFMIYSYMKPNWPIGQAFTVDVCCCYSIELKFVLNWCLSEHHFSIWSLRLSRKILQNRLPIWFFRVPTAGTRPSANAEPQHHEIDLLQQNKNCTCDANSRFWSGWSALYICSIAGLCVSSGHCDRLEKSSPRSEKFATRNTRRDEKKFVPYASLSWFLFAVNLTISCARFKCGWRGCGNGDSMVDRGRALSSTHFDYIACC